MISLEKLSATHPSHSSVATSDATTSSRETSSGSKLTVVIPHVYHWDLGVGHAEKTLRKPHGVPFEIEGLQLFTHRQRKVSFVFMMWIFDLKPRPEKGALAHDSVVVNLVSSANHYMEWSRLVTIEHISPERIRSRECIRAVPL